MALGFGFNKVKVMAAAEKYVQQGKLQNAVGEYEKVIKEDPNDLTVLNTIGDLQSRLGQNVKAVDAFKKVGEAYAKNGFTVKAIAMYKKLTKLSPDVTENLLRLAELYTIQGLYNDARGQYVHVADAYLKSGNNDEAANVFQKILELDPDNAAMQTKLADLYIKLGKKSEARNIFFTAAQSLYAKQSMDASAEALEQVLVLDPKNVDALLLRGTIAAEAGDGTTAMQYLGQIPEPDANPDALRGLLRAQLLQKNFEEARNIVSKLASTHKDATGASWYAETLLNAGDFDNAMQVYDQYGEQVIAANKSGAVKFLNTALTKVKDSPKALEVVRKLFKQAGDTTHEAEILELLGHAYAHDNDLKKAKEIYKQLAESEPDNPLHEQNYKQIVQRLGEDVAAAPLTAEQGAQALMIEEMDHKAPVIVQSYSADIEAAVQSAIADSELFDSYNLPAKAVAPLEKGLEKAPRDFQINQRLANLYPKMNRFADAAKSCQILSELYTAEKNEAEAKKFAELSQKYLALAPELPPAQSSTAVAEAPAAEAPAAAGFSMEVPAPAEASVEMINLAPPAPAEPPPAERSGSHDFDMDQWESMLSVDAGTAAPPAPTQEAPISMEVPPAIEMPVEAAPVEMAVEAPAAPEPTTFDLTPPAADAPAVQEFGFESAAPVVEEAPAIVEPEPEPAPPPPPPAPKVVAPPPPPPEPKAPPAAAASAATKTAPKPAPEEEDDLLGDLVSGLEDSLGDDFSFGGKPTSAPPPKVVAPPPPAPQAAPIAIASAAAAQAEPEEIIVPAPVAPESVPAGFSSMSHDLPTEKPAIEKHEATSALSDMFSEFKEDAEESAGQAEDPDTHYNLGIAFKEMGLLDEAIGELQKVCHAIEHGHAFEQSMQAYTWLAQCLVDKGVPQAAVRWYEKALKVNGINEDSRLAVYYDLGNAYEAAGNQKKAYETFMEVYSSNIDYRDVADRIKTLKA